MILERLVMENFKQFRDRVELLPPEGAVGIVGANGSGKTTIFESILWAFFGSRGRDSRFSNDSIPWSGGTTAERTTVEITLNVTGTPYRVVRTLQKGKTEARVYAGEEELLGGPSEVTEWVQESLLGMDRVAFEATFFARQKELEFFAGVTGVKRQREVARILGIDQVETAQELLRADKKELQNEAKFLEARIAGIDRDALEEELREAREQLDTLEEESARLQAKLKEAEGELAEARAEGEKLEEAYRRHNALSGALAAAESARERASERAAELREMLAGLDADAERIEELKPRTEGLAEVEAEIEALEEARRRHERRELAEKDLRRLKVEAHRTVIAASELLERLDGAVGGMMNGSTDEPLPGWGTLSAVEDEVDRMLGAKEVLDGAATLLWREEERFSYLKEAKARHEELLEAEGEMEVARARFGEGREEVTRLDREMEEVGGEALEESLKRLRKEERSLQRQSAQQKGLAEADERDAEKLDRARRMIEDSEEVAQCPTCHRGFEGDEHRDVIETLQRQAEEARERAEEALSECRRLEEEAGDLLRRLGEVEELQKRAYALREKRTKAATQLEGLRDLLERASDRAEKLRGELGGVAPVSVDALDEAEMRVGMLRMLHDAHPRMEGFVEAHARARESVAELEGEILGLQEGPAYVEERHARLRKEKAELERLIWEIEGLEERLRGRPQVEERLEKAREEGEEATREAGRLREEISVLAFDEKAHGANRRRVSEAEELREGLRAEKETLDEELRRARSRVENLQGEIGRYDEQRRLADEKAGDAAKLGEMDRLLARFYKELTARVRPRLEREAGELVKVLTDGRYERMEFDENYGVRLFDGLSEAYEISRFSGGESDVVSLCARVALSKMVAEGGSESLGFIVLDEVFGALDADRRRNVLLALDRLKKTFGQIFIISHVGDVQESALLDELWTVEEDEAGKSTVRRVKVDLGGEPVELLDGVRVP